MSSSTALSRSPETEQARVEVFRAGLEPFLHSFAGILLFCYSASHIGFLTIRDYDHTLRNTVFPFATNWALYLSVAILETIVGLICLRLRGRDMSNLVILTFVAVMVWYRWAFYYTGGEHCGCLGLLGRLIHVTKYQEKAIPIITLVVLTLTTVPWFIRRSGRLLHRLGCIPPIFVCLLLSWKAFGEAVIEVHGFVDSAHCNPVTGKPHPNPHNQWHSTFIATMSGRTWIASVTNKELPSMWEERAFDGTNGYVLEPEGCNFMTDATNLPKTDLCIATVTPSIAFVPLNADPLGVMLVCFTYGFSPNSFKTNKAGVFDMPVPWSVVRDNPRAWGYKWSIQAHTQGRFLENFEVVRDSVLDLPEKQELLRFELDYPETLGEYNGYVVGLRHRKEIPSGFVRARYQCNEWCATNGIEIPLESELKVYAPPPNNLFPGNLVTLKVTDVMLREGGLNPAPVIVERTLVDDYRFKKATEKRIFKFAHYTLQAGESWRPSDDPELLAQANAWLINGRKYQHFAGSDKLWAAWLLLGLISFPVVAVALKKKAEISETKDK